ncbi:MAG: ATP-binding protein, partial [Myxococcales bacterium]|nr:ATP-binding protein [Myxococcales bacterium]
DFLRELVQNALDAGSDRVEVRLEAAPTEGADDTLVYMLTIADTGAGMDEGIIDGELTRLFASTKGDDRTMAGGFGIGFVSVFAWRPEAVLLQTGRAGESWELLFYGTGGAGGAGDGGGARRTFAKRRLDVPVEGTTITLVRRGPASEGPGIAEAVRDSLWRWCRYCRLEITFEDLTGDGPLELIQDSPSELGGELSHQEVAGDHTIRVAFTASPRAVLLRRGLILAEGGVAELMPGLAEKLGEGREHLQLWVDSPSLRTTLARDKVVQDAGHGEMEAKVAAVIDGLRERLLAVLVASAAVGAASPVTAASDPNTDPAPDAKPRWDASAHRRYAFLHGHLAPERASVGPRLADLPVLRERTRERPMTPAELGRALAGRPLLYCGVDLDEHGASNLALARSIGYPVIAAEDDDRPWLARFAADLGVGLVPLRIGLDRVTLAAFEPACDALLDATMATLRAQGGRLSGVQLAIGDFPADRPLPALVASGLASTDDDYIVLHSADALAGGPPPTLLWFDKDEPLLRVAIKAMAKLPTTAVLGLAAPLAALIDGDKVDPEALAEAARREAAKLAGKVPS